MRKDWAGQQFEVAEEFGEYTDIVFVRRYLSPEREGRPYEFHILKHSDYDGIGALSYLMEREGFDPGEQPTLRDAHPPGLLARLRAFGRYSRLCEPMGTAWKPRLEGTGRPDGFVVFTFTQAQTQALYDRIAAQQLSSTAVFISTLDAAASPVFLEKPTVRRWLTPVNMRGGVTEGNTYANASGNILLNLAEDHSPREIHDLMRSYLQDRLHWGSWAVANLVKYVGKRGLRNMAEKYKDTGFGILSNLGDWPWSALTLDEAHRGRYVWSPTGPATRLFPVMASCMIWDGRLSFNLQLHPSLGLNVDGAAGLMQAWLEVLAPYGLTECEPIDWPRQGCTITYEEIFASDPIVHERMPADHDLQTTSQRNK